jgi:ketopantoate reductase
VARGTGRIEADFLNGEICLVGRLHGVATPVNARLQRLAGAAARGEIDGPLAPDDLLAQLRN